MDRLTFEGNFYDIAKCEFIPGGSFCEDGSCSQRKVWERLKAYEDTHMTPSDVMSMRMDMAILTALFNGIEVDRVRELVAADKAGRVVVMPCKIGDKLYRVFGGEILESQVQNMRYLALLGRWDIDTIPFTAYAGSAMGATIFSTREEAEAALEAMKDE